MVKLCTIDCCTNTVLARGMCRVHYMRKRDETQPQCSVDECESTANSRGLCRKHYQRWYKHGTVERTSSGRSAVAAPPPPPMLLHPELPQIQLGTHGYLTQWAPWHPLARSGMIELHRMVLYSVLGPGTHQCHWCDAPIWWRATSPKSTLTVDHVDNDRLNNSPSNLVPACVSCNVRRGNDDRHRGHAAESGRR